MAKSRSSRVARENEKGELWQDKTRSRVVAGGLLSREAESVNAGNGRGTKQKYGYGKIT